MKYVNMDSSEALDTFVQNHFRNLAHRIHIHPNKYSVDITVKANAKNSEGKITSYEVDGTFRIARRASIRASKKASDVHKAVTSVIEALEKQVQRQTEKQERSRKTIGKSLKSVHKFKMEVFSESE